MNPTRNSWILNPKRHQQGHKESKIMLLFPLCLLAAAALSNPLASKSTANPPTVTLSNANSKAIFVGRSLPKFNQDLFLGIKYADKPIRFTPAQLKSTYASNDSNSGAYNLSAGEFASSPDVYYNATEYGYDCPAYGSDTTTLVDRGLIRLDEDCLNLNVIRPSGSTRSLPVMLWVYGGGWQQGATADPRYVQFYIPFWATWSGLTILLGLLGTT